MIYILEKSPNMKMFTSKNTQTFSQKYANFYLLMCSSIVINTYFIRRRTPATSRSRSGSVTNLQSLPQLINRALKKQNAQYFLSQQLRSQAKVRNVKSFSPCDVCENITPETKHLKRQILQLFVNLVFYCSEITAKDILRAQHSTLPRR